MPKKVLLNRVEQEFTGEFSQFSQIMKSVVQRKKLILEGTLDSYNIYIRKFEEGANLSMIPSRAYLDQ